MSVGRSVGRLVTHSFDDPHVAPIGLLGLVTFLLNDRMNNVFVFNSFLFPFSRVGMTLVLP